MHSQSPTISLLHATRGRAEMALRTRKAWLDAATYPDRVEHLFAVDGDDPETIAAVANFPHVVVTKTEGGCVAAWNLAASQSHGDILVQLSDNMEAVEGWDAQFGRRLRDIAQPGVLRVNNGYTIDDGIPFAVFTRPWLRQLGSFLHPEYFSQFSIDEFGFRAYEAGVVIDARDLVIQAKSPESDSSVPNDATYKRQKAPEHYFKGEALFLKRNPEALRRWIHQGTGRRQYLAKQQKETIQRPLGLSAEPANSGRRADDDANWQLFGRKLDALLTSKNRHSNIFENWINCILSLANQSCKGFFGKLAWGTKNRRILSELSSATNALRVSNSSKKASNSIPSYLKVSRELTTLLGNVSLSKIGAKIVDKTTIKALKAEQKALEKWWGEVEQISQNRPDLMGSYPWTRPVQEKIPIYITSYNQPTYLRNMVRQLRMFGVQSNEIHVVDNGSTSIPLKDYLTELQCQGINIHHLDRNFGPRAIFEPESGITLPAIFALTDPDLQFDETMPSTFREDLLQIALWCRVWKAGSALNIKESKLFRQGAYHQGLTIREWEDGFWKHPILNWNAAVAQRLDNLGNQIFSAAIDTTFAVYLRDKRGSDFGEAVRVAGSFEARHLPWYEASEQRFPPHQDDFSMRELNRNADARFMVRPGLLEVEEYVRNGFGSTISNMKPSLSSEYLSITHPVGPYSFAIDAHSAHLDWWNSKYQNGEMSDELQLLRVFSQSTRGPSRLIDIGASFGPITLWAALRFEHVYAIESNQESVSDLRKSISINKFEHCITVLNGTISSNSKQQHLTETQEMRSFNIQSLVHTLQIPLNRDNLIICCHLEGEVENLWTELLQIALEQANVIGAIFLRIGKSQQNCQQILTKLISSTIGPDGYLKGWQLHSGNGGFLSPEQAVAMFKNESSESILAWFNPNSIELPS